jgi:outer membrane protein insertion porin family
MKCALKLVVLLLSFTVLSARADSFTISDIRIEGLQRISSGSVFASMPISIGQTVDEGGLRNAARALFATGNFEDIQIARDGDILVMILTERPSISEINIEGNKAIETEALLEGLKGAGLAEGQVLKRATLEGMRMELQRQYVSQGRYDAGIETEVVEQPRNRVAVSISVDEGNVAKIKHINIVGNEVYDDETLRDLMEVQTTGWLSWITSDDKYSREKLKGDLEAVESFYLNSGYARFNIDSTQVSITPDKKAVYITVNIVEGGVYTISEVELSGDLVVEEDELMKFVVVQQGQAFSQGALTQTEDYISKRLSNDGYSFAKVSARPDISDEENTVAVKFFVDPGKRTYVNRITFTGNANTSDEVLRRELRQMEGAPASSLKIDQGQIRLQRLGFFGAAEVETIPVAGTDDLIDVSYVVEEQPSGSVSASVGFAQDSGLILGANLQQNNFLGSGKQVGIGVNSSRFQDSANFSYVNPYYTDDGVSRGFSIFARETDYDEANVASYSTNVYGANMNFGYPIAETQRLGFSVGFQHTEIETGNSVVQEIQGSPRPVDGVDEYIDILASDPNNSLTADVIGQENLDSLFAEVEPGFIDENGDTFDTFTVSGSWNQSTLNRGQLATRGAAQSLSLEMSIPGSDLEYYRLTYTGQIFVPISRSFTLRFRGEIGFGEGYGETTELPFFQNFYAGGFGSVRGFKSNTLGPRSTPPEIYSVTPIQTGVDSSGNPIFQQTNGVTRFPDDYAYVSDGNGGLISTTGFNDRDPFGGNLLVEGSMELLFPLPFVKDQRSLRSAFFIDVGNVFDTTCGELQEACFNFDAGELRYSAGVGLTWITGFGPLSFSLAKPLNDGDFDETEVFQFSLGQFF